MLYFYKNEVYKSKENLDYTYESFVTTDDLEEGWLVWYEYVNYDSFSTGSETNFTIIDIYDSEEKASEVCKMLINMSEYKYDGDNLLPRNSGSEKIHNGFGWGLKVNKIAMKKIKIKDKMIQNYKSWNV